MSGLFRVLAAAAYAAAVGDPCAMRLDSLSKASAMPGETFELRGSWGVRAPNKVPRLNKGDSHPLGIVEWTDAKILVRIPPALKRGTYRVGVYCTDQGVTRGSTWKDFEVLPLPVSYTYDFGSEAPKTAGGAEELRDKARALWMKGLRQESAEAYTAALEAYRRQDDEAGQAACLYGRALIEDGDGDFERADADNAEAARLYRGLLDPGSAQADAAGARRLQNELADVLYGLARSALRAKDMRGARAINLERLGIYESLGDEGGRAVGLSGLGEVAMLSREYREAADLYRKAADAYRLTGNEHGIAASLKEVRRAEEALLRP